MNVHSSPPPHTPADIATGFAVVNAIFQWLPQTITVIAGLLAIVWYCVLLYDKFAGKPK